MFIIDALGSQEKRAFASTWICKGVNRSLEVTLIVHAMSE